MSRVSWLEQPFFARTLFFAGTVFFASTVAACGDSPSARALRLLEFRQRDFGSVALNEELLFYFSADLDPSSITSDSLRILDEQGREVGGERAVRRNALSFLPDLPCASDLSDGGLRPGSRYRVILGGFPRPDGIRSASGTLLSAGLVLFFGTAQIGGTSPLFLDPFLGPFPLLPRGKRAYQVELEDGLLVLEYGEAIDPSSVPGCRFELSRASEPAPIATVARLIVNRRNHAELLLEPSFTPNLGVERLLPDTYWLRMPGSELRTLGGRAVEPGWGRGFLELRVPGARVELDLGSARERSDELPPGCDGTAQWSAGKGLRLRYPAAAGNGLAGGVELRECPPASDLQATGLSVAEGNVVDLSALQGPVVLRSQTLIEVRGRLTRRGMGAQDDPVTRDLERASQLPSSRWTPLSTWVTQLLDSTQPWSHEPWTVLIAGGDLRIPEGGSIDVDGPLVLVAGGRIRVEGSAFSRGDLWKTEPGGSLAAHGRNLPLPLALDEPVTNPLRTTLRVGALTRVFNWNPRTGGWRTLLVGHEGGGSLDARFLQTPPENATERLVSDPSALVKGEARALLLFELGPGSGEPWQPPWLERLELEAVGRPAPATKR